MIYKKLYGLSLGLFLIFISYSLQAQIQEKSSTNEEFFCRNKDYQFMIFDDKYFEHSKVYICANTLPTDITIVDLIGNPVNATFTWKLNGNLSNETTNTITINSSDFDGDKLRLICEFEEPITGKNVTLSLRVNKGINIEFDESAKNYQFDDNNIDEYRTFVGYNEPLGTPWNFIEEGKLEILLASTSKSKGFDAVNKITSDNSSLEIDPEFLSQQTENITFEFTGTGKNIIKVNGCKENEPELLFFTSDKKTIEITFYQLCDTDDDFQVNPVSNVLLPSTQSVCINGGEDLWIDGMFSDGFLIGDDEFHTDGNGRYFVIAGTNRKCETGMLSVPPNPTPSVPTPTSQCPGAFDVNPLISGANDILKKVGIRLEISSGGVTPLYANYDLFGDPGMNGQQGSRGENGKFDEDDQNFFQQQRFGSNPAPNIEVYLVDDLGVNSQGNNVSGRGNATTITLNPPVLMGLHTLSLNVQQANSETFVHELGHAFWELVHPDEQFNVIDLDNIMHGISNQRTNNKFRRYQFDYLH
jgi:hypothetical protein